MDTDDSRSVISTETEQSDINHSRYNFGFCDLYHPILHGPVYIDNVYQHPNSDSNIDDNVYGKFLYIYDTELGQTDQIVTQRLWRLQRTATIHGGLHSLNHPVVRNYVRYAFHTYHIEPQIVEIVEGPGDYTTCILKTHFLRLLQRKWKHRYAQRKKILSLRKNPVNIQFRKRHGRWPAICAKYV